MGEHSKSAIIKYTRKYLNMTQEELSEGICDSVTLARYENGSLNPSDEKFFLLMQKMGISGEKYVIPVQNRKEVHEIRMKEILYALETANYQEVKKGIEALKGDADFSLDCVENQQYIGRIELILEDEAGKLTNTEYIKKLEKILKLTFPDYNENHFPVYRLFTENEVLIISNIARQYAMMGKRELAIRIYYNLEEYFQTGVVVNDYKPRYLELVNLSNLLGRSGRYDESMEICKRGIKWLLRYGKSNYLYNFYYNMGWLITKKVKNGEEDLNKMKQAECYIWMAYQLVQIYPENKESIECILDFCKENFS